MGKIIPYSRLARQQHLNFLEAKRRQYRERENYLLRLRKLLFKIEGQMRTSELQQLELFRDLAAHFKIPLEFPSLGDRLGLQQFFNTHPMLVALQEFFAGRLTPEECYGKIVEKPRNFPPKPDKLE